MDAYAVRKMAPRILLGVIAINLSIYICLAALDISKVVANGVGTLITRPFLDDEDFDYTVGGNAATDAIVALGAGYATYKGGQYIYTMGKALIAKNACEDTSKIQGPRLPNGNVLSNPTNPECKPGQSAGNKEFMHFMLICIVLPIALLALSILVTLAILQGLIVFLVVVSPVAFGLYILPSTEKYFQKWWDIFRTCLMVYPILAIIFAMSKILSAIIFNNNSGIILGVITGTIVMFLPLFLIPFAFKLAGGAVGQLYGAAAGVSDRVGKSGFIKGRQEFRKQKAADTWTRRSAEQYRRDKRVADDETRSAGQRARARSRMSTISGYRDDIYQREAAMNERLAKEQEQQKNFGDDTDRRAYGIDRAGARSQFDADAAAGALRVTTNSNGRVETDSRGKMRRHYDAAGNLTKTEYSSLGGSWQTDSAIDRSEARFGQQNTGQLQQTLTYEMSKAIEEGKQDELIDRYGELAGAWGMSADQRAGTWIGPAFNNQQEDLMFKHTSFDASGNPTVDHAGMTREVYEKKGPQMLAYLKGKNVKELRKAHSSAVDRLNGAAVGSNEYIAAQTELKMHESIMDTLASTQPTMTGTGAPGAPAAPSGTTGTTPPPTATGGRAGAAEYGYTTGSGHTTDELKQYFSEVKDVAQQREQGAGGAVGPTDPSRPLRNPFRAPSAHVPVVESQAAEANPDVNREHL